MRAIELWKQWCSDPGNIELFERLVEQDRIERLERSEQENRQTESQEE